jgi:hypothetical protein
MKLSRYAGDYAKFHKLSLETGDVDPVYPVLRALAAEQGLTREDTIRLVFMHVAFYHLGSGLAYFSGERGKMPCATERRGHRDERKLALHLDDLETISEAAGGFTLFLDPLVDGARPKESWERLVAKLQTIYGNGRWASYKTAEMLWKVAGLPVQAPDMGHANSSGPRQGLALLTSIPKGNGADVVNALNGISDRLCNWLHQQHLPSAVEEVETTLCDFHALVEGRYYIGNDIDQMLRQLLDVQSSLTGATLAARRAALPDAYLGEIHGWSGPDPLRKRIYKNTRQIVERP